MPSKGTPHAIRCDSVNHCHGYIYLTVTPSVGLICARTARTFARTRANAAHAVSEDGPRIRSYRRVSPRGPEDQRAHVPFSGPLVLWVRPFSFRMHAKTATTGVTRLSAA